MLKQFGLKNFKSWESLDNLQLAPVTGIFGANSSGKSSILQALLLLKQTLESPDRTLPLNLGGERDYVELGMFREVVWSHKLENTIEFSIAFDLNDTLKIKNPFNPNEILFEGEELSFISQIDSADGEKMRIKKLCYGFSDNAFCLTRKEKGNKYQLTPTKQNSDFRFLRTQGRSWDLPQPVKFHGFPDQTLTYYQNTGFLLDLQREFEDVFSKIFYLGPLRDFPKRRYTWSGSEPEDVGRRGERAVDAILAARDRGSYISRGYRRRRWSLDRMLAFRLKEMGLINSFSVRRIAEGSNLYQVFVKKDPTSAEVMVTDVGFGVSQVLPVIVLCYYVPEGSTIIFELPEIHLHPSVQSNLADVFLDVAKNRKVQIIVESHSENLLLRLQRRIAESKASNDDVALYFCETRTNTGKLERLNTDTFGNIQNWPKDFFGDRFGETIAKQEAALNRQIVNEEQDI